MPSPRDIPQVLEAWKKLDHDQLHVKYHKEYDAYKKIRDFFLEHSEYTHLAICPDDLVITPKDLEILAKDLQGFNFPVLSGICNVGLNPEALDYLAVITTDHPLPSKDSERRHFEWAKESDLEFTITRVNFSGFPLFIIRRDIVERFEFDSQGKIEGKEPNSVGNLDVIFAWNCHENKIPIFVDKRAKMLHLRGYHELRVGKDDFPPRVDYICKS